MLEPTEASPARSTNRWAWYVLLVLLVAISLVAGLYTYVFVRLVPPISGEIVDAITGKPVPGMSVCLQVDSDGWGEHEVIRKEIIVTGDSGRFFFRPSVHQMQLLQRWEGFSIRVTDAQNDLAVPCGPRLGPGLNETHPDQHISAIGYFPVVLVRDSKQPTRINRRWSSTRRPIRSILKMHVPVIPVLPNSDLCQQIQDARLADDCRELIIEASATLR